jgi:hypothetical protein
LARGLAHFSIDFRASRVPAALPRGFAVPVGQANISISRTGRLNQSSLGLTLPPNTW